MDSTRLDCSGVLSVPKTMRLVPRGEEGPVSYNVAQTLNHMKSNLVKTFFKHCKFDALLDLLQELRSKNCTTVEDNSITNDRRKARLKSEMTKAKGRLKRGVLINEGTQATCVKEHKVQFEKKLAVKL